MQGKNRFSLMHIALLAGMFSGAAHAVDHEVGKPALTAWGYGILVANATAATSTGTLRCSQGTATQGLMGLNIATVQGQAMYSMLLAATTAGRTVTFGYKFVGTGCEIDSVMLTPE